MADVSQAPEQAGKQEEPRRGMKRRTLLRNLMWGSVGLFLAEFSISSLALVWPRKVSGFGSVITAGKVTDFPPNSVTMVREGKFFISHVDGKDPDTGEDYQAKGFIALYWKCVHLGCTVPWAPAGDPDPVRHFHCPCHSSTYDRVGRNTGGPAPRPLDYMELEIRDGTILVNTGKIVQREEYTPDQVTPA